jgi:hypothetical protein
MCSRTGHDVLVDCTLIRCGRIVGRTCRDCHEPHRRPVRQRGHIAYLDIMVTVAVVLSLQV